MPKKSRAAKTYCSLREAFDLTGRHIFGEQWQGFEADCDPARAKQQTDTKSLRFREATDGRSFTKERLPDPKRPIDGKDGATLTRAAERHIKALAELLRLTHKGFLLTEFIPENETTTRQAINPSAWPDPAEFDPKKPTWGDLWFGVAADRVVLKSAGKLATSDHGRDYGDLWWAYTGRPGRVEIDRRALEKALRPPDDEEAGLSKEAQKKGGTRRKYHKGLQHFINERSTEFAESGKPFSLATLIDWLLENARDQEPYETGNTDCDDLEFVDDTLFWTDPDARPRSLRARSLEPYIRRARRH